MKTIISRFTLLVLCLGTITSLSSCDKKIRKEGSGVLQTVTRSLDNFSAIQADGKFDITYHVDDEPRVVVTTDNNLVPYVQTFILDGRLVIEMSDDYFNYHFTKMKLEVYSPLCDDVDLNGSVEFSMVDTVYSDLMDVFHNGSGYASVKFTGDVLKMKVNGSADVRSEGIITDGEYTINGSGKIDALDAQAYDVDAEINGSGKIYVSCSHYLHAKIDGSGDIRYIGNPTVNSEINGSGSVGPY